MSDDEESEGLNGDQATALHKGATLSDGPYELSYDDDRERYYFLRYEGEVHSWSYSFKRVERTGEETFNLADKQRAGFYLKDIESYPLLRKALITLVRNTPDKPPKDRK